MADVHDCIQRGRICVFAPRGPDWVGGAYLLADVMVYVQALAPPRPGLDFNDLVPCLCTTWRTDPCRVAPSADGAGVRTGAMLTVGIDPGGTSGDHAAQMMHYTKSRSAAPLDPPF